VLLRKLMGAAAEVAPYELLLGALEELTIGGHWGASIKSSLEDPIGAPVEL